MKIAKIFKSGNSQAVRLPKQFEFHHKEVEIFRQGTDVILREKHNLIHAFELITSMPDDFFSDGRQDEVPQQKSVSVYPA